TGGDTFGLSAPDPTLQTLMIDALGLKRRGPRKHTGIDRFGFTLEQQIISEALAIPTRFGVAGPVQHSIGSRFLRVHQRLPQRTAGVALKVRFHRESQRLLSLRMNKRQG